MVKSNQIVGEQTPLVAMFHLMTNSAQKKHLIGAMSQPTGRPRVVMCSSSLSMGMNLTNVGYILHYGPSTSSDAFFQETGRASREASIHGHSILMKFPRMAAGRNLDTTMKTYVHGQQCLRNTLLSRFKATKPDDQQDCCDVCDGRIECFIKQLIEDSYASSLTDTFSDDSSVASLGDVEEL